MSFPEETSATLNNQPPCPAHPPVCALVPVLSHLKFYLARLSCENRPFYCSNGVDVSSLTWWCPYILSVV